MKNILAMQTRSLLFLVMMIFLLAAQATNTESHAQTAKYDEARVPAYTLPDPLVLADGTPVADAATWHNRRRPEILRLFEQQVYGKTPDQAVAVRFETVAIDTEALGGTATRKEITILFGDAAEGPRMHLLLYLPNSRTGPAPTFVGPNFYGNHSIHPDPGITLSTAWMRNNEDYGVIDNQATEASRGVRASRWPVERILGRGYALATVYYGDLDPDFDDGFQDGIHPLFYQKNQTTPTPEEWGSIGAWAWGVESCHGLL